MMIIIIMIIIRRIECMRPCIYWPRLNVRQLADKVFEFIFDMTIFIIWFTVYPKKYAHGFCFAVLCCGYTLTDFPISIRLTSLALWQSNDCPSASKATPMNMDKYFMWIHYERLHNHKKAKHNKTVCTFLGIYCRYHWIFSHECNCWYASIGSDNHPVA